MTINIYTLAEPSDDRKIEMADKKTKEENVCGRKEGLHRVYTGHRAAPHS